MAVLLIIRESVIPINKKHFASSYPISSKGLTRQEAEALWHWQTCRNGLTAFTSAMQIRSCRKRRSPDNSPGHREESSSNERRSPLNKPTRPVHRLPSCDSIPPNAS